MATPIQNLTDSRFRKYVPVLDESTPDAIVANSKNATTAPIAAKTIGALHGRPRVMIAPTLAPIGTSNTTNHRPVRHSRRYGAPRGQAGIILGRSLGARDSRFSFMSGFYHPPVRWKRPASRPPRYNRNMSDEDDPREFVQNYPT